MKKSASFPPAPSAPAKFFAPNPDLVRGRNGRFRRWWVGGACPIRPPPHVRPWGPKKFWSMNRSIGPQKIVFYCISKKEFWGYVVLWDQIFLQKIGQKFCPHSGFLHICVQGCSSGFRLKGGGARHPNFRKFSLAAPLAARKFQFFEIFTRKYNFH